jgi:predicted ATPase
VITLSTTTNQETFDTVVRHLVTQGHRAMRGGTCIYFDRQTGDRCAIGALIPGEELASEWQSRAVRALAYNGVVVIPNDVALYMLDRLQRFHDSDFSWTHTGLSSDGWDDLRRIADDYHLNTDVLDELQAVAK